MTNLVMLAITFTLLQVIVVTYLMRQIWDLESDVDRLEREAKKAFAMHRENHCELGKKHAQLFEALEMEFVPLIPSHYRRKGNYD